MARSSWVRWSTVFACVWAIAACTGPAASDAPAASEAVAWSRTFGTAEDDRAQRVATDGAGAVYVAGTTEGLLGTPARSPQGVADGFVRKFDAHGVAQWTWQFGTSGADRVLLLEPQPNGDVIVGGVARGDPLDEGAQDALFLARFDAASQRAAWWLEFGADVARTATAMARDALGNVWVAASPDHLLVVQYDPDGGERWRRRYEAEVYNGTAARMVVDAVGGVVATGSAYQVEYVLRLNPEGAPRWRTRMSGLSGYFHGGRDVAIDPEGNVAYVGGGFSWSQAPSVGWVSMVDADGVERWLRDVGPGADTTATSVAAAPDGSLLVGGWSAGDLGVAGGSGAFAIKYTGDGDRLWVQRFAEVPPQGFAAVATDALGNGYAVATVPGAAGGGGDVFLVRMAP